MNEFQGKRVVVTGATKGIGAAVVARFRAEGATVIGAARTPSEDQKRSGEYIATDITRAADVTALAAQVLEKLGGVDVVVHVAGGSGSKPGGFAAEPIRRAGALSVYEQFHATARRRPGREVPASLSKLQSSLCDVRLLDPDGNEVPDGEPGEVGIRGPTVFSGYWDNEKANAHDFANGYFRMGDVFRKNPDATFDFVDRAKYLIKSGGENIYPAEIERVLLADRRITDAVVVRKKDDKWGEVPVAFVSIAPAAEVTVADVDAMCRAALAGYKRPREIRFVGFDDFPRSTTGKIQRHEVEKKWL